MRNDLSSPILYLITNGKATNQSLAADTNRLLELIEAAVSLQIPLIQIREKQLSARSVFELARRIVDITRRSPTNVLVNDRADIASAVGAAGVQLTARSLDARVVRAAFGREFVIGVSTHSTEEALSARDAGADFALFGPIFETVSKLPYGVPAGLERLREVVVAVGTFRVIAIGGISDNNAGEVIRAGTAGIAAIGAFDDPERLKETVHAMRASAILE